MDTTYSRKKSYSDNRNRPLEFDVGAQEGEVESEYVGPYEVLQLVGKVVYELALPAELASAHSVFHVSMLKKFLGDPTSILLVDGMRVDEDLSYEEILVKIPDRQVKRLRNNEVAKVKKKMTSSSQENAETVSAATTTISDNRSTTTLASVKNPTEFSGVDFKRWQ
ncbi:uncharacterized protein [Solanum lycopersicum]|uniref:uncharacterized protein n=1 Tax=Solanum lycopersicum TaxID=4081 RepID=UPI0037492CB7